VLFVKLERLRTAKPSLFLSTLLSVPVLITLLSVPAFSNTYVPNTLTDPVITTLNVATGAINGGATISLRSALIAADTLGLTLGPHTVTLSTGTYNLTQPLPDRQITIGNTSQNITINGNGPANTIINNTLDANKDRILFINPAGTTNNVITNVSGIRFQNAFLSSDLFGGAAIDAGGGTGNALTVTNCTFDNNVLPANAFGGAAVCMQVSGNLTVDNSTFTNNVSNDADGGAIFFVIFNGAGRSGVLSVTNSTFTGNSVVFPGAGTSNGGAIAFTGQGGIVGSFNATITNNTFISNTADGLGGAISANNSPNLSIPQIHFNRFFNNTSAASALSSGLHFAESSGSVNAENNWWGCNSNPVNGVSTSPCNQAGGDVAGGGALDANPWLQLRNTPAAATIVTGQTTTISADILGLSSGGSTSAANLAGLLTFPSVSSTIFSLPVRGNLSATNGQFVSGVANLTPTFTASSAGAGSTSATADNQTIAGAITINKANTTTSITNNPATTVVGQGYTVNFSLAVNAPGSATPTAPTGNVMVSDGSQSCTGAINAAGTGSCLLTSTTAGNKSLTATYQGDANFNASPASAVVAHTVNKADTSVGLTSATNPSVFGQSVTFTATMAVTAPGAGNPTGTIQFLDGGNPITGCTSVAIAAGQAQCLTSALVVGNHTITAAYGGDANFNTSNGSLTGNPQVVNKAGTSVGLTSATNPSVFGQSVTFTATIAVTAPGAGTPSGTFNFLDGGNPIAGCQNVAIAAGQAQCVTSALTVGNHTISAAYSGDGNFNTSTGNMTGNPQAVNKASTSVGLTSATNPSVRGQSVTFTATIGVTAPGAGTPTGTVQFLDGGNPITGCTSVTVAAGQAQCLTSALVVGNHTITAAYSGDGNFNTSNGTMTGNPQVVNKANTSMGLTSSQNPAPLGTNLTITAMIGVTPPGAGTPSGTVQFLDGVTPIVGCTAVAVAAGQAQCMTTALTVGNHTITATYSGDTNFNTSNGSLTGNPQVITGPPMVTPVAGLNRRQGSAASNSQIATVSDDVGAPGSIVVTAMTVPPNMTITNIVNTNGTITADLAAGCGATLGNNIIVLKATDGKNLNMTANLTINVLANTAPTLGNYANSTVVTGCKLILTPDAVPGDNGSVQSVMASGSGGFTGAISVNATTGVVTITNNGPVGGPFTITVTATDNCGLTFQRMFTVTVNNPPTASTEFDFDGDRKSDIAVYRGGATPSDPSFWYILRSSDNMFQPIQFGADSDVIVPGDWNGDGTTEVGIYRPSNMTWYTSTNPAINYGAFQWGAVGDIPVPGQYDADNKTDIAVFRPSNGNWYIRKSTGGTEVRNWGQNLDKPIAADVDGDGKTDLVQYRESSLTFFIQKSSGGTVTQSWGQLGDKIVLADYDGDGKDDIAVFRPSNNFWYILQSTGGTRAEQFGQAGDIPVPADYDNDGKADLAVYRPGTGSWIIFKSCPCTPGTTQFGISTDKAIPSAFTP
jgi:hypothetical protein